MSIKNKYPAIRPSLDLDFTNSKTIDPRITFSRASTATYYDGKTVAKAEENLLTYSQEFDNGIWTKVLSSVSPNSVAAPDGSVTADTFSGDGTNATHCLVQASTVASGVSVTYSVYAKAGTNSFIQIATNSTQGYVFANFDLTNGVAGTTSSQSSIASVGNGWYRCSITFTSVSSSSTQYNICLAGSNTDTNRQSNSLATSIYIWGAQLEQRSQATAYTPTTSQPITNYVPVLQTAAAGVPRIDHDPITGECKGLLIEEQRTNLLTYSEQFDNASWTKTNTSIISNAVISPDGTLTADKIVEAVLANDQYFIGKTLAATSGTAYTMSVYAKSGERSQIAFQSNISSGFTYGVFNLATGQVVNTPPGWVMGIYPIGNGWYRCSVTLTADASVNKTIVLQPATSGAVYYSGNGYSGIYIWGAQLEAGSFPTSYIKTEASQATRAADSASMTGANFSGWYRQDKGTFAQEFSPLGVSLTDRASFGVYESSEGFYTNSITVRNYNGSHKASAYVNSIVQAELPASPDVVGGSVYKIAYSYQSNYLAFARSGVSPAFSTSASIPVVNTLLFPGSGCQHIKRFAFYPKALPTYLQALTT